MLIAFIYSLKNSLYGRNAFARYVSRRAIGARLYGVHIMTSHLNSVAMLVDFSASQWTARKIDKAKSDQVNDEAQASRKASHVSKKLVMADTLNAIATLISRARAFHVEHTSPWLDAGPRILSAAMHGAYVEGMEKFEVEFHPLVTRFVDNYPSYIDAAQANYAALGQLFNANDYPKTSRIAAKFAWRLEYMPIPTASDFRVDIGQATVDRIKAGIERRVNESAANAVRDVFERVYEKVAAMVEKLGQYVPADGSPGSKTQGIFRDSLVENVRDLVTIMPALNFTNDPRITALAGQMAELVKHDADTLRESDNIRETVASQAAAIVQAVSDFMA